MNSRPGMKLQRKLTPKSKWVVDKLLRNGYGIVNQSGPFVWLALARPPVQAWAWTDPCNLIVQVEDGSRNYIATFRPSHTSDIHVTRYLLLGTQDGWERLWNFEQFFLEHRDSLGIDR